MQKRLTRLGNSLALVLDKPLREILGLGPERIVEVKTDGSRLVIEPVRPHVDSRPSRLGPSERRPSERGQAGPLAAMDEEARFRVLARNAPKVVEQLVGEHGMTQVPGVNYILALTTATSRHQSPIVVVERVA
jgi:bifunctional DNA-binding transcriptional regulator/antitoxin component of YhaV-PrlF toxin-antitoxin module